MAYAGSNTFSKKVGPSGEPSGKSGGGKFSGGSAGVKGEPSSSGGLSTPRMTTKGNAKKA